MDALIVLARAVHFAAVALLFGAPLFRLCVAPRGAAGPAARAIALAAAGAALLSALGWFVGVAAGMAGGWSDAFAADMLGAVGFDTRFGKLWIARLALLAAIIGLCAPAHWSRRRDTALLILAAAVTASLVGAGHGTAGSGALGPIHAVADAVHLLCAATWLGGLFCLALVLRRAVIGSMDAQSLEIVLPRFSHVGYAAVTLLLASGCTNALVLLPRPEALITTDYGRVLLVKIALTLLMVALALFNRVALAPRVVAAKGGTAALWRSVVAEQGIGLAIIVTVAWLGTIHPAP